MFVPTTDKSVEISDGRGIDREMPGRARSPADSTAALGVSGSIGTGAWVAAAATGVGGPNVGDAEIADVVAAGAELGATGPKRTAPGVAVPDDAAGGSEGRRGVGVGVSAGADGRRGVGVGVSAGGRRGVGVGAIVGGGVGTGGGGGGGGTGVGAGVAP